MIVHLGMSGSLRLVAAERRRPGRHDHVDLEFDGGRVLRLTDPRRFRQHSFPRRRLARTLADRDLGVEPLGNEFDGDFLHRGSARPARRDQD